jgi:hypothetical protein
MPSVIGGITCTFPENLCRRRELFFSTDVAVSQFGVEEATGFRHSREIGIIQKQRYVNPICKMFLRKYNEVNA